MENTTTVLVTGGTGFVGMHILLQLLQKGYTVRTMVRHLNSQQKIKKALAANGITHTSGLSFIEAELTDDTNWAEAMQGCTYVLSVASPVFFDVPANETDAIRPAVEGIRRVLRFAAQAGVQRVVMTSNFGAVGFSQTDQTRETTEADWTDTRLPGLSVYEKSKTLAEKAAWAFIQENTSGLELVTINPVWIIGPSLDGHLSGSFHLLENLLSGKMKMVPGIALNVVDVRDVADLHIRAMTQPEAKGMRFIATADGQISLPAIAALLKKERPGLSAKVSTKRLPDVFIKLASWFNATARQGAMFLRMNRKVSNARAKTVLGWMPRATQEETILATVDSMALHGLIP